jgi:hypothetical protein
MPSLVRQVMLWELARMVAVKVVPLLPPRPTIIKLEETDTSVDCCGHVGGEGAGEGKLGKNLPGAWDLARGPELESLQGRLDDILVAVVGDTLAAVVERGGDVLVRVGRLVRLDKNRDPYERQ